MKYCSIDLETTGLNPNTCQILEFGAVLDDTDWWGDKNVEILPTFHAYVLPTNDVYTGEPYALWLNSAILKKINDRKVLTNDLFLKPHELSYVFEEWLVKSDLDSRNLIVAGKNFTNFDQRFLEKLPNWNVKFNHRVLDPSMLYFNPHNDVRGVPSMKVCMERAGISGEVAHTAVADAKMVIELIRKAYK